MLLGFPNRFARSFANPGLQMVEFACFRAIPALDFASRYVILGRLPVTRRQFRRAYRSARYLSSLAEPPKKAISKEEL